MKDAEMDKKVLKYLAGRLNTLQKDIAATIGREEERAKSKMAKYEEYESIDEAQEAYGMDMISEQEYEKICDYFDNKDAFIEKIRSQSMRAQSLEILNRYVNNLHMEIREIEFTEKGRMCNED